MSELTPTIPEPDEQFISSLEQQLRAGIRRRAMLDPIGHPSGGTRRKGNRMFTTASLMLFSLTLGATGTFAVVHEDLAPQRELHLQKASILLDQAQARLEQRKGDLAEMLPLSEQGVVGDTVILEYKHNLALAESELRQREMDLKETRVTGRAPVDDLTGPLIAGEDFITHRLVMQHDALELQLQRAQVRLDRTMQLIERGVISENERSLGHAELEEAENAVTSLQERINLRASFINGEMQAEEAELRAMLRDAEAEHTLTAARFTAAQQSLQRIATLHALGQVTESELRAAQAEIRDGESNLSLAEVQLKMIRQRLDALGQMG